MLVFCSDVIQVVFVPNQVVVRDASMNYNDSMIASMLKRHSHNCFFKGILINACPFALRHCHRNSYCELVPVMCHSYTLKISRGKSYCI